jgi:Methylamine utilisation protein MauE
MRYVRGMRWPSLIARIILGITFVVAAVAKLRDPLGTVEGTKDLGVPNNFASIVAKALAPIELIVSALLIWRGDVGGAAALLLLVGFTVALGLALAKGKAPRCHCFGRASLAPAGRDTLIRNVALAGLALVATFSS